jgi:hypothetical protein
VDCRGGGGALSLLPERVEKGGEEKESGGGPDGGRALGFSGKPQAGD